MPEHQQPPSQHGGQPPNVPAPPTQPRKKRRWPWVLGGSVAVIIVIGVAAGLTGGGETPAATSTVLATTPTETDVPGSELGEQSLPAQDDTGLDDPSLDEPSEDDPLAGVDLQPQDQKVIYSVSGHTAGTLTYTVPGSTQISQVTGTTDLPWSKTFTVPGGLSEFDFLSISAQNAGSGTISCSIRVDGQLVAHNSSTGLYAITDCSNS